MVCTPPNLPLAEGAAVPGKISYFGAEAPKEVGGFQFPALKHGASHYR